MEKWFNKGATAVATATGKPISFLACVSVVVIWAISGPFFGFSETWQLIINTSTTIITFLMVFLIQNTQNRDGAAIQAKLDELILSGVGLNEFVGIERLTEKEVEEFRTKCEAAAKKADQLKRSTSKASA
ncbi:low affinity iron permease family protein [Phyllobacterium zundukense]|uniref:Low affinity iron permease family protein n=1 Tax=Phyllobacterium zundukense TaxID=1867719 RepID=A0ACD4CXE1_9HYPH|nr:low affinity iron permease family protein [Phyllobacterium zundukense]UXN58281.1 low affinity iron permease family protein [Phyllobacterium zundukense]